MKGAGFRKVVHKRLFTKLSELVIVMNKAVKVLIKKDLWPFFMGA
jgi:hypothetical protein